MAKKRWRDLTDLQKQGIVRWSAVHVALIAEALVEIYQRVQG